MVNGGLTMPIDWLRIQPQFLAEDRDKSYWKFPSTDVVGDLLALRRELPKLPKHELIACKDSILAIFDGKTVPRWCDIGATIDRISSTIVAEGMGTPVAKKGKLQ